MTAAQVSQTAGIRNGGYGEHETLRIADEYAARHLTALGGAIMADDSGHLDAVADIARAREGETIETADKRLAQLNAGDEACTRYAPEIDAAYYFGLAVGLRLAGGTR